MSVNEDFVPPDGGYGWVIIIATTTINICLLPLVQCFGIIYQNDFEAMGITAAEKSFLLHLHSAIFCSLGLLSSPLLKKFSYRQVSLFGTSLMCFGILLSSFAQSYIHLIFSVSVIIGIGQGIVLPATYVATNTYFKKRLTLAMCLSITGASLSPIFMPQVCNSLVTNFGSGKTVLVLFGISLVAFVGCALLKPLRRPTKGRTKEDDQVLENLNNEQIMNEINKKEKGDSQTECENNLLPPPNGFIYQETTTPVEKHSPFAKIVEIFNLELLKERAFLVILIGMSVSFASELNIVLMIQFILPELAHFNGTDVSLALSIQSVADLLGRLGIPMMAHMVSVPPEFMYASSLAASSVTRTLLAIFSDSRYAVFFCCVLLGLAKGTKAVFQSVIVPKYVTLDKFPAANGLNMLFNGSLSLMIGPLIGLIHDSSGSYIYALHAASVLSISCVLLWAYNYPHLKKKKQEVQEAKS